MGIILDVIFILIVILFMLISAKKGFVRTFLEISGIVLAMVLAVSLSGYIADFVCSGYIIPGLTNLITSSLEGAGENLVENIPAIVVTISNLAGLGEDFISTAVTSGASSAAVTICESVTPFLISLIKTIAIVILFFVLNVIFRFLAKRINSIFNISILGKVNKLLGAFVGIIKGAVFAVLFCIIVSLISSTGFFGILNQELIESSFICKAVLELCSISI